MELNAKYPCDRRNFAGGRAQVIRFLVIHYTGAEGGAKNNAVYFSRSKVGASAHFFVGHGSENGAVYQSVDPGDTAWHCGTSGLYHHPYCRNGNSIGVELCCHKRSDGTWYFDPETVIAAIMLARELIAKYRIPAENLLRHYDVSGKNCPAPFVSDGAAWANFKALCFAPEGAETMTEQEIEALVERKVTDALAERDEAQAKVAQKVSPWAKEDWDAACRAKLFDGTRPGAPMTREMMACVLARAGKV